MASKQKPQTVTENDPKHYRLRVGYAKLGIKSLEEKFPDKDSVLRLFDGRLWERHSTCAAIDETPGDREFRVAEIPAKFLGNQRTDKILDALSDHFDLEGFRFAIEIEAIEFADALPNFSYENWIYAFGSSAAYDDGFRCVAVLGEGDRDRILKDFWVGGYLDDNDRLLLVRKQC